MNIQTQESWPAGWMAYDDDSYDGPGSALGHGQSEDEAIEDLKEQLIDRGIIEPTCNGCGDDTKVRWAEWQQAHFCISCFNQR